MCSVTPGIHSRKIPEPITDTITANGAWGTPVAGDIQQLLSALPPMPPEGVGGPPPDVQDVRCVCLHQPILLRGSQVRGHFCDVSVPEGGVRARLAVALVCVCVCVLRLRLCRKIYEGK